MALQGSGYEVLGVSVGGHGPLGRMIHIDLGVGVTALYGLNGSGKTNVLRCVENTLRGIEECIGYIHIRVLDPTQSPTSDTIKNLASQIGDEALKLNVGYGCFHDRDSHTDDECENWDSLSHVIRRKIYGELNVIGGIRSVDYVEDEDDEDYNLRRRRLIEMELQLEAQNLAIDGLKNRAAHDERISEFGRLADQGYITLQVTGTSDAPRWDVYLSAPPSDPQWSSKLHRIAYEVHEQNQSNRAHPVVDARGAFEAIDRITQSVASGANAGPLVDFMIDAEPGPANQRWPSWLPIPVLDLIEEYDSPIMNITGGIRTFDSANEVTMDSVRTLLRNTSESLTIGIDGRTQLPSDVQDFVSRVESTANQLYADLLVDSPPLYFDIGSPSEWFVGKGPAWRYVDSSGTDRLELDSLSNAQGRWANTSISLALLAETCVPTVLLCDEPELGLHKLAERRLPRALSTIAERESMAIILATHSPLLLSDSTVDARLVRRSEPGFTELRAAPMSIVDRLSAETSAMQLGTTVGDLLLLMKLALVVEGLHDEIVFGSLLSDAIYRASATILPMHGGRQAKSLADARLLFDATDAEILVVFDNLNYANVSHHWESASRFAIQGDFEKARSEIDKLRVGNSEHKYLHQLGIRALEVNRMDRIHIFGLSRPDVICYLPENLILSRQKTGWDRLIMDWENDPDPKRRAVDIKKWLAGRNLISPDSDKQTDAIQSASVAAARADLPMHPDLIELAQFIVTLGTVDTDRSSVGRR